MYQTEKQLMEHKENVPQEDQDAIRAAIAAVKDAVADESTSSEALKEKVEELKKASMKIGEAMYKNMPNEGETGEGQSTSGDAGAQGEQKADYEDVKDKDKK